MSRLLEPWRAVRDPARLALGTLTAVPVPAPDRIDRRVAGHAMLLAPVVGAGLGVLAAGTGWAALRVGLSPFVSAVLVLGVLALATRGLHLDGLADTADGLAASYDRQRALDVMRRGDAGPAGVATLALVLLLQAAATAELLAADRPFVLIAAYALSRAALTLACLRGIPCARPDGLGATVAGSVGRGRGVVVLALTGLATVPYAGATCLVVLAVVVLLLRRTTTRLGGITGDVLGACVEAGLAAALVALTVLARW